MDNIEKARKQLERFSLLMMGAMKIIENNNNCMDISKLYTQLSAEFGFIFNKEFLNLLIQLEPASVPRMKLCLRTMRIYENKKHNEEEENQVGS